LFEEFGLATNVYTETVSSRET